MICQQMLYKEQMGSMQRLINTDGLEEAIQCKNNSIQSPILFKKNRKNIIKANNNKILLKTIHSMSGLLMMSQFKHRDYHSQSS